jgi:hypothetical protein
VYKTGIQDNLKDADDAMAVTILQNLWRFEEHILVPPDEAALVIDLRHLVGSHALWSQETFGADTIRGPIGPARHLRKEADEIVTALEKGGPRTEEREYEYADAFLLLLDVIRRDGLNFADLVRITQRKLWINKRRKWSKPTEPDQPVEHVR